ncbi:MAG: flavin reductase family protein [Hyphomonadaceae bacterium]|nr:flavin reductase family protein [Hyphomonadaceae bacterium]
MEGNASLDAMALRAALGAFATGVTIVTAAHEGADVGVTANSFNSVSLDPPMVLWSLSKSSQSLATFAAAEHFAVHILAHDQEALSNRFAKRNADKFAGMVLGRGIGGSPLLPGYSACFQCRKVFEYEGGDHIIFVGEVAAFEHQHKEPLLFHGGRYAKKAPEIELNDGESDSLLLLVTDAYYSLRELVLQEAERNELSLAARHLLGVLAQQGGRTIVQVNQLLSYVGISVDPDLIRQMVRRDLVRQHEDGGLWITALGHAHVVALVAAAKAREAEAELQLGPIARQLKAALRQLLRDQRAETRHHRHIELIRSAKGATGN